MSKTAIAIWQGSGKEGNGNLSTESHALDKVQYSWKSRFADGAGTNPEELIAAAHAGCFTMAFSGQLSGAGLTPEKIETTASVTLEKTAPGWTVTESHLQVTVKVPNADRAAVDKAAHTAETNCPISRLLNAKITMDLKIET